MNKAVVATIFLLAAGGLLVGGKYIVNRLEGKWVCESGEWVKKGNPLAGKPATECERNIVERSKENLENIGQCYSASGAAMDYEKARLIAEQYCVNGDLSNERFCNDNTGTWWIGFEPDEPKEGCNPACVVFIENETAEINWRCTGLTNE